MTSLRWPINLAHPLPCAGRGCPAVFRMLAKPLFTNVTGFLRDAGVQPSTTFREDRHKAFAVPLVRQLVALSACSPLQSCVRVVGCDCAFLAVCLPVLDVVADSGSGFSTDSSGTRLGDNSDHLYLCPARAGYESSDDEDMAGMEYESSSEGDSDSDDEDGSYGEPADMFKGVHIQRDVALPTPLPQGMSRPDAAFQGARPSEADLGDMLHHFSGEYSHPLFTSRPWVDWVQHLCWR